jgi:hypothetical protein
MSDADGRMRDIIAANISVVIVILMSTPRAI